MSDWSDPFVHLHVASSYSMRYGACPPEQLAARAAELEMGTLALTDRDGVYGVVKFARACERAGVRPLFGVDLAVSPEEGASDMPALAARAPRSRTPVRGGMEVDRRLPRVTLLAQDGPGWARLCRLVSAAHSTGGRGTPVVTREQVAEQFAGHAAGMFVLLGPQSEVGRAVAARRPDRARSLLSRWSTVIPRPDLLVEVVNHRGEGDAERAAAMVALADDAGLGAVLANSVRYLDRAGAAVVDVLDAVRRLVPLDGRHVDRRTAEGYLKSSKEMAEVAEDLERYVGGARVRRLLAETAVVAQRCAVDPRADLGIDEIHFPELSVTSGAAGTAGPSGAGSGSGQEADADAILLLRCEAGLHRRGMTETPAVRERLTEELSVIRLLGYPTYFLTVAEIVDLIRGRGIRCAARGSGAGSLVNYLLGISDVDPMRYGLLMERFLSPLRRELPDIDIDVESARRLEVYQAVMDRFGTERCACVSMMETYRARHAIRDVGAALALPAGEVDAIAKAFPHIRASQVRAALQDLPELRASGWAEGPTAERMAVFFRIVEQLDGLPRHIAMHPCGLILSDATLLDRTPVEDSFLGFPMSQFDKDDVEDLGLLKLDLLGIRMQSAIVHALSEVERVDGAVPDIDGAPRDDPDTFGLIQSTRTLGCFQIESPGQRELIGKFAPETFDDIIIDISLFRPGPVKSDMVTPFLEARQGWRMPSYLYSGLESVLRETGGVIVFHEQVLRVVSIMTGCSLAEADEVRRSLGDPEGQEEMRTWFRPAALAQGHPADLVERAWEVLKAFGSFGFCKAHAAAFALPTYQSAWLKAHHPAAFVAGVLTHDPGMYPKRLILDDARQFGIAVLGLDVNCSEAEYRVERVSPTEPRTELCTAPRTDLGSNVGWDPGSAPRVDAGSDPGSDPGTDAHCDQAPAALPPGQNWRTAGHGYGVRLSLSDVKGITDQEVQRIVSGRPYASLSDFWLRTGTSRPVVERLVMAGGFDSVHGIASGRGVTRRDLLLQVGDLDTWSRSAQRMTRGRSRSRRGGRLHGEPPGPGLSDMARGSTPAPVQLALDLGDTPTDVLPSGLPEMTDPERVRAELEILGVDASSHVLSFDEPMLEELGVVRSQSLLQQRSRAEVLVAGVKVATQTPPVRSGRRVIFVTLDDASGPVDATFFEDAQGEYAATVFHSWMLLIRGVLRRTGPSGVSVRATGCWDLTVIRQVWERGGIEAVYRALEAADPAEPGGSSEAPATRRKVLVHPTGFRMSPYADIRPAGGSTTTAPRRLWHSSPGSAGG